MLVFFDIGIFNQEITAGGEEMDDHSQVNKPNLGIPIQAGELDDNGVATEEIDAGTSLSIMAIEALFK